jgi:hypothetical protein
MIMRRSLNVALRHVTFIQHWLSSRKLPDLAMQNRSELVVSLGGDAQVAEGTLLSLLPLERHKASFPLRDFLEPEQAFSPGARCLAVGQQQVLFSEGLRGVACCE